MIPPEVEMIPVESSNLAAAGYVPAFHRLYLRFHNGSEYSYENFPPDQWRALLAAPSKGKFVLESIRGGRDEGSATGFAENQYAYTMLRGPDSRGGKRPKYWCGG